MDYLLLKAKDDLVERAMQVYLDRRSEIEFVEYADHFKDLGSVIASIDELKSLSELTSALEKGKFEVLGLFPSDEDMFEEFFRGITAA